MKKPHQSIIDIDLSVIEKDMILAWLRNPETKIRYNWDNSRNVPRVDVFNEEESRNLTLYVSPGEDYAKFVKEAESGGNFSNNWSFEHKGNGFYMTQKNGNKKDTQFITDFRSVFLEYPAHWVYYASAQIQGQAKLNGYDSLLTFGRSALGPHSLVLSFDDDTTKIKFEAWLKQFDAMSRDKYTDTKLWSFVPDIDMTSKLEAYMDNYPHKVIYKVSIAEKEPDIVLSDHVKAIAPVIWNHYFFNHYDIVHITVSSSGKTIYKWLLNTDVEGRETTITFTFTNGQTMDKLKSNLRQAYIGCREEYKTKRASRSSPAMVPIGVVLQDYYNSLATKNM